MNFQSTITLQATTPGFEDVSYTFNKMTEGRRIKLRLELADPSSKLRELIAEATRMESEDIAKAGALLDTVQETIDDKINPAWVRWGLRSIEGLMIDDEPATVDSLIESGPRELFAEIADAIKKHAGLSEKQRGESVPPSISSAPADGRMSDTSAAPVVH